MSNSRAIFKPTHSLKEKLSTAKRLIKQTELDVESDDLKILTQVVSDIMEVDPNGNIFRYPESIKGDQHLKGEMSRSMLK